MKLRLTRKVLSLVTISTLIFCCSEDSDISEEVPENNSAKIKSMTITEEVGGDVDTRNLSFNYDNSGKLIDFSIVIEEADGNQETVKYEFFYNDGNITSIQAEDLIYSFSYNDNLISQIDYSFDNISLKLEFEYNFDNEIELSRFFVNDDLASTNSYIYDEGNLISQTQTRSFNTSTSNYSYDQNPSLYSTIGLDDAALLILAPEEFAFSKNNVLTASEIRDSGGDRATYSYTYREDGLPASSIGEGIFDAEEIRNASTFNYE